MSLGNPTMMWRPHSRSSITSSRSSARNVDLYLESAIYDWKAQLTEFPPQTEMWGSTSMRSKGRESSATSEVHFSTIEHESASQDGNVDGPETQESSLPHVEYAAPKLALDRRSSELSQFSYSTLAEKTYADETDVKTPKVLGHELDVSFRLDPADLSAADRSSVVDERQKQHPRGPLEETLLSLVARVSVLEWSQPTIMAEEYLRLQQRLAQLEAEKRTWAKRHEDLYALRDEDVSNLVKVRDLLAKERQVHAELGKLRDDDLKNLVQLREKLARAVWSATAAAKQNKKASTAVAVNVSTAERGSRRVSRSEGNDLWQMAKMAATEQRVLELEQHNTELQTQLDRARAMAAAISPVMQPQMLEVALRTREQLVAKVERLRVENEGLRRDLDRKDDECLALEHKIECFQRRQGLCQM